MNGFNRKPVHAVLAPPEVKGELGRMRAGTGDFPPPVLGPAFAGRNRRAVVDDDDGE